MSTPSSLNSRHTVVNAAVPLFGAHGYEATGIRDIARTAGITTASLYYHFPTKADLLEHIVAEGMRQLIDGALSAVNGVTHPVLAIDHLVTHHVRFDGTNPRVTSVIDTEFRSLTGDRLTRVVALRDQYDAIWDAVIKQGASDGFFEVQDERLARLALIAMCKDIGHWYSPSGRLTLETIAQHYSSMALQALHSTRSSRTLTSCLAQEGVVQMPSQPRLHRFYDVVSHWAQTQPHVDAWRFDNASATYAQFRYEVRRFAKALLALGVRKGDRVAMLSTPRPEYWTCFIASASIGAVWVGLNPRYQLPELQHIVSDSEPNVLFGLAEFEGRDYRSDLATVVQAAPSIQHTILFGGREGTLHDFLKKSESLTDAALDHSIDSVTGNDASAMVYTSGTTGTPKGALLSQAGLCHRFSITARHAGVTPVRMVANLPINHVGGMGEHGCMPLMAGGTLIFQERFSPEHVLSAIETHGVTVCMQIPTMLKVISEHANFFETDWSSVRLILWGGGALPAEVVKRYRALQLNLKTMYGITEAATALTFTDDGADDEILANTTGKPVAEYSVGLLREDGRLASGPDEEGEVLVDNRGLWLGYHNNQKATDEATADDGRYRTGDIGILRDDGNLMLVGRLKEMFKSGGYNVYPREVELVIEAHPDVRLAVVAGTPDPHYGETGVGFVEVTPGSEISTEDLASWCREQLANYKVPKRFSILEELPLLPNGKLDRKGLKAQAQILAGS